MRSSASLAALALVLANTAAAQQPPRAPVTNFVAEDALNVIALVAADLTDDGRYVATTSTLRRDVFGTDFRHDGDPTYLRVAPTRLTIIDTKSGASTDVFKDKRAVRNVRWAPDGRRLAMLIFNGDMLEPTIWDRTSSKLTTLKMPAGKYVAENSDIRWSSDGKSVLVATHSLDWRKKSRDVFLGMTTSSGVGRLIRISSALATAVVNESAAAAPAATQRSMASAEGS
ncbi:MAG: hypothetical protein ABI969_18780 [bacterium]